MTSIASNLQINSARLWDTIHESAKFGATPKGGVRRLTLGPEDKQVRDWFRSACEAAGLDVHVDGLGGMFGLRKGRDMSKPPIGLGSHLDTQTTGGKFDGVLGTLAALEVVRTLNDAEIETEADLHRQLDQRRRLALRAGHDGVGGLCRRFHHRRYSVAQGCRRRHGGRGAGPHRLSRRGAGGHAEICHFVELHIEQGPILEAEGKTIGVVDSGQGVMWYDGKITGFESHAGSTPMPLRRDALATLSEIVLAMESIARKHGPKRSAPSASRDRQPLAQRHSRRNRLYGRLPQRRCRDHGCARQDLRAAVSEIAGRRKVEVALDLVWRKPPTHFDPDWSMPWRTPQGARLFPPPDHVRRRSRCLQPQHRDPAAMVFVPCKDGVSHNELEDATQADCTAGANVLMHTVLALAGDRVLTAASISQPAEVFVRGIFDANEALAIIFERLPSRAIRRFAFIATPM